MMKRESGANPEQTRCCKLCIKPLRNTHIHWPDLFPVRGLMKGREGSAKGGVSQKTCQMCTLFDLFRVKRESKTEVYTPFLTALSV